MFRCSNYLKGFALPSFEFHSPKDASLIHMRMILSEAASTDKVAVFRSYEDFLRSKLKPEVLWVLGALNMPASIFRKKASRRRIAFFSVTGFHLQVHYFGLQKSCCRFAAHRILNFYQKSRSEICLWLCNRIFFPETLDFSRKNVYL